MSFFLPAKGNLGGENPETRSITWLRGSEGIKVAPKGKEVGGETPEERRHAQHRHHLLQHVRVGLMGKGTKSDGVQGSHFGILGVI